MLIKGVRVLDPGVMDQLADLRIINGIIDEILAPDQDHNDEKVIDARGKVAVPGLIDMHVHLREPGHEYKETIQSGCLAAARGGFTTVCVMPNTRPVNDNRQVTEFILQQAARANGVRVLPVAAITKGLAGEQLCEYADLKAGGAVALSDDGRPVVNPQLMRRAMEYAAGFNLPLISHCEELSLADGVMNEGYMATSMGLSGIPNAAESIMVMREIALAQLTDTPIHIAHVSTEQAINAIRVARQDGIKVTAETAPHYFMLTDEAVHDYNTNAKMNPPLRSRADREAVRKGLADGTISVIATDHAPHSVLEKEVEFDKAANGVSGLETSLCLGLTLVEEGILTLEQLITAMSLNPAKILNLKSGIRKGLSADITIIDPNLCGVINSSDFLSKGHNTPFEGFEYKGGVSMTIAAGKIIFEK